MRPWRNIPLIWMRSSAQDTDKHSNVFIYPTSPGPNDDFDGNLAWELGSTQNIQWNTSMTGYVIEIFQQKPEGNGTIFIQVLYRNGSPGTRSFEWTVQTYNANLTYSPVYYFVLGKRSNVFISHYFNITNPSSSVSSPVRSTSTTIPTSSMEPTTTVQSTSPIGLSASSRTSPSATTNPSATSSSTPSSDASKLGLGIGLGLGIPLILGLAALLAWWLLKRRRSEKERPDLDAMQSYTAAKTGEDVHTAAELEDQPGPAGKVTEGVHTAAELEDQPASPQVYHEAPGHEFIRGTQARAELEATAAELRKP